MKIPIEYIQKKFEYIVYVYGALDVRLFPNQRLNVDLKNSEIRVSYGLEARGLSNFLALTRVVWFLRSQLSCLVS